MRRNYNFQKLQTDEYINVRISQLKEDMAKALRIRKLFGGAMRQVGFLAAAAIYALDNHIDRLAEDHRRAKQIGKVLESCSYVRKIETIETNIVIFYVNENIDPMEFIAKMESKGILMISMGQGKLRIVTHLDFTETMLEKLISELEAF